MTQKERLEALEAQVAELKARLEAVEAKSGSYWFVPRSPTIPGTACYSTTTWSANSGGTSL